MVGCGRGMIGEDMVEERRDGREKERNRYSLKVLFLLAYSQFRF